MALSFRALFRWMLPGNYHAPDSDGEKVLWSLALVKDIVDQLNRDRLTARFPSYAGESALALIGADRGIPRGRGEAKEHYAARLLKWRWPRGHRVRGNAPALLEQIWEYFGGGFDLYTTQFNQQRWHRAADGTESTDLDLGWDWDSLTNPDWVDEWSKFWVVIDGTNLIDPTPNLGDPALYGGGFGDSSYALGHVGVSADDVNAMRRLFRGRAWKPAGTRAMWAVVSLDGSAPNPTGEWGRWGKLIGTNYVATRSDMHRYWALDPTSNVYAGDPKVFASTAAKAGGGTFGGDATSFPTTASLPGGVTYGGDPSKFPASARLVDDGSIP